MAGVPMSYGTMNLQSGQIITSMTDVYSGPEGAIQLDSLAQSDGGIFVRSSLKPKTFTVSGRIIGASIEDCDFLIDQLKLGLRLPLQNFDYLYAGSFRRYIATAKPPVIARADGLDSAGWSVQFVCASPVGMDTAPVTLLPATAITTSTASIPLAVGGTYQAEPLITLTLTAVTGGGIDKTLTLTNGSTLRGISIRRTWSNGDVVEIDSLKKTVYVNSQIAIFDGTFPKWDVGAQTIGYLDDFTTRTASITAEYTRRWL